MIFDFQSYRDVIRDYVQANSSVRGYQTRLAEHAGCQGSYFSQVLKGSAHLTPDQAIALCEHWKLEDLETEYFLGLVNYERAGSKRLKVRLMRELERIRHENRRFSSLVNPEAAAAGVVPTRYAAYYWSNWECAAIHEILRLEGFRTISAIAARFSLPVALVKKTLDKLGEMGLVTHEGNEWRPNNNLIFEDQDEGLVRNYHRAMRERSNYQLTMPEKVAMTFTCVDVMAKSDIPLLAEALREVAKKQMKLSDQGPSEELVCLCLDFFVI